MTDFLCIPIQLDGLLCPTDRLVLQPNVDPMRLPYRDGPLEHNAAQAFISENAVVQPFDNRNFYLHAGLHLHWSLPDALGFGRQTADGVVFPRVPNRWLLSRRLADGQLTQWVIESDYLHPIDAPLHSHAVAIPSANLQAERPFRFLGRTLPLAQWLNAPAGERYPNLTVLGFGEPSFASFYPNSFSVFGFHDAEWQHLPPEGTTYDLLGWYSDLNDDPIRQLIAQPGLNFAPALLQAIQTNFRWQYTVDPDHLPDSILCYGRLAIATSVLQPNLALEMPMNVAIGTTGTEALSAYLAATLAPEQKSIAEDQLEAALLADRLDHRVLDIGPAFYELRHEKGFNALNGGVRWFLRPRASSEQAQEQTEMSLPTELAHALNQLNRTQAAYDRACDEVTQRREQLFADWYKYMLAAYPPEGAIDNFPDSDLVRSFIEHYPLRQLTQALAATGELQIGFDADGELVANDGSSAAGSLAYQVAVAIQSAQQIIAIYNQPLPANQQLVLRQSSAPRFWQPNEPVVLLIGAAAQPSDRHGADGLLTCQLMFGHELAELWQNPATFQVVFDQLISADPTVVSRWECQPWHPLRLEWEVEVFPLDGLNTIDGHNQAIEQAFSANYSLGEQEVDLAIMPERQHLTRSASLYSGFSLLTGHAETQYQRQLAAFQQSALTDSSFAIYQQAAEHINHPNFHCLAQSLGGFNAALLMQRQTFQLPIREPLGFADYQAFTAQVAQAVAADNWAAPQPLNDFLPIRTGAVRLQRLRLVDNFGQVHDLDCSQVIRPEAMQTPANPSLVWLPPRFVQPSRVNLRWLAAADQQLEMNDHPLTSPICGWFLPNLLDQSVEIYAADGQALGLIDRRGHWQMAPANTKPASPDAIEQPILRQTVQRLIAAGSDFLQAWLDGIEQAAQTIAPEQATQHNQLALLIGHPLALVQASLDVELQGLPALDQSWNSLRADLQTSQRDNDRFAYARVPLRLGEYHRFNDGLIGYWLADDVNFYLPQVHTSTHELLKTHSEAPLNIPLSPLDPALIVTMLVDPRGHVHVASGINPLKSISIPAEQYQDALGALAMSFLTAPILSDDVVRLPQPTVPGYSWQWVERHAETWRVLGQQGQLTFAMLQAFVGDQAAEIWQWLQNAGWLTAIDPTTALVVARDQRPQAEVPTAIQPLLPALEYLLETTYLHQPDGQTSFARRLQLREGWLRLQPQTQQI